MTKTITIDLKKALTDEAVTEALPHLGKCRYSAPCIVGAMIPKRDRKRLDNEHGRLRPTNGAFVAVGPSIDALVNADYIKFADDEQGEIAYRLQNAFDHGGRRKFDAALRSARQELGIA